MGRLRYNNAVGTLGASLTNVGTTITFSVAPPFATITGGDYIPLVLEPPSANGASANFEVVWLNSYTAGATTGGISRGQEGTTGKAHNNGVVWLCGTTAADLGSYVNVDGLVAAPRSVTDWGVILNAAIAAGGRVFQFGTFDYPFTTRLNANGSTSTQSGVRLLGTTAMYGPDLDIRTKLIWNGGNGDTIFIDFGKGGTNWGGGGSLEECIVCYPGASFTGKLVNLQNSYSVRIKHCYFGVQDHNQVGNPADCTANCALYNSNSNTTEIESCWFDLFARGAIIGQDGVGQFATETRIRNCALGSKNSIVNAGINWELDGCVFEMGSLASGDAFITGDKTGYSYSNQITLKNCSFWDPSGFGYIFYVPSTIGGYWDLTAIDCQDSGTSFGQYQGTFKHHRNGALRIFGGAYVQPIDFGDPSDSAQRKTAITVVGANFSNANAVNDPLQNAMGHPCAPLIAGNTSKASNVGSPAIGSQYEGLFSIGHEVATRQQAPSISVHGGATNVTAVNIFGNDNTGLIYIENNSAGVSSTGLLADITFALPTPTINGVFNVSNMPCVLISPTTPSAIIVYGGGGAGVDPTTFYDCKVYAYSPINQNTGFSIGCRVAMPAHTTIYLAYRVVQL